MQLTPEDIARAVPRLADGVERVVVDGQVRLRSEELRRGALGRLWAWLMRLPKRITVELDDIGAFVIDHMDGRDLDDLSRSVADHLRLTKREARVALTEFVRLLLRRRLIRLEGLLGDSA